MKSQKGIIPALPSIILSLFPSFITSFPPYIPIFFPISIVRSSTSPFSSPLFLPFLLSSLSFRVLPFFPRLFLLVKKASCDAASKLRALFPHLAPKQLYSERSGRIFEGVVVWRCNSLTLRSELACVQALLIP